MPVEVKSVSVVGRCRLRVLCASGGRRVGDIVEDIDALVEDIVRFVYFVGNIDVGSGDGCLCIYYLWWDLHGRVSVMGDSFKFHRARGLVQVYLSVCISIPVSRCSASVNLSISAAGRNLCSLPSLFLSAGDGNPAPPPLCLSAARLGRSVGVTRCYWSTWRANSGTRPPGRAAPARSPVPRAWGRQIAITLGRWRAVAGRAACAQMELGIVAVAVDLIVVAC